MSALARSAHSKDLSETLDAVAEAFFEGAPLTKAERGDLARRIAETQGLPGAYAGMFALSPREQRTGFTVFTGERMASASARHIAAEEALRALHLLKVDAKPVRAAMAAATSGMLEALDRDERGPAPQGIFCCGKCTVALWRTLAAGGLDQGRPRLENGLRHLKSRRDGEGGWHKFPFFYTLLALIDTPSDLARREIRYASPLIEHELQKRATATKYARRKRTLLERALTRI